MARWPFPAMIGVYLSALAIRLAPIIWPGLGFAFWGSDTAEYHVISSGLVSEGTLDAASYEGWGFAYPYFPGMYIFTAAFEFCGIDTQTALLWGVPAIASLVVFPLYLIAVEITRDRLVGVIASALAGLSIFHVYASSHPVPGSIGAVLGLFCLYLLLVSYRNAGAMVPLILCAGALVITHHLSAFILLLAVGFISVVRIIFGHRLDLAGRCRRDITFMAALWSAMIIYWGLFAEPFADRIVTRGTGLPLWAIALAGYAGLLVLWWLAANRARFSRYAYWPGARRPGKLILRFGATATIVTVMVSITILFGLPGTDISVAPSTAFYILPLGILASLASVGTTFLRRVEDGFFVYAWAICIAILFFLSIALQSEELLVYRYSPYMMEPVAIMMACGLVGLPHALKARAEDRPVVEAIRPDTPRSVLKKVGLFQRALGPSGRTAAVWAVLAIVLLAVIAAGNYPPKEVLGGFEEGIEEEEVDGVLWAREELSGGLDEDGTVLSDHRMSSMLFGYAGMDASWDSGGDMLHSEDLDPAHRDLTVPSGEKEVQYTVISAGMEEATALEQWETAKPLEGEAREKYDEGMWKVFDNGAVMVYSWPA
jgi:hypothetical protein